MLDLQTVVGSLVTLLLVGGPDAAVELIKGSTVNAAVETSNLWRRIFTHEPDSYSLANRVAKDKQDETAQKQLRAFLESTFKAHPELLQGNHIEEINIHKVSAKNGGVAVGVSIGGQIHQHNNPKDEN